MWKRYFVFTVLLLVLSVSAAEGAIDVNGVVGDDRISLTYDPATGNLGLDTAGHLVTTLEVVSASGTVFTGETPDAVQPPFDVHIPEKFFILKTEGVGDMDFGPAAAPNLTKEFLASDLTIDGSIAPNGAYPGGGDLAYVPEPTGLALIALGIIGLLASGRRRTA